MKRDAVTDAALARRSPPCLWRDPGFWWALLLGITGCEALALAVGYGTALRTDFSQWRQLLWLVLLYPFVEEWLFRGVLQPQLLRWRAGGVSCCRISAANVLTSLLFAALHLFTHPPLWAALVLVPSLLFGAFRDRYNSFLPGTLLHGSYNLAYLALFGLAA